MGTAQCLHEIMNEVSSILDAGLVAFPVLSQNAEIDAFCVTDPLLFDLNKQYLNACQRHAQSAAEYGADAPMTEMAAIVKDSAQTALQTRLLEVKAQEEKVRAAKILLEEAAREEAAARRKERERQIIEDYRRMELFSSMGKYKEKDDALPLWIAIFVWLCHQSFLRGRERRWQEQFNRLAA